MPGMSALLMTRDGQLLNTVRRVIKTIPNLRTEVVQTISEASSHLHRPDIALYLPHLVEEKDTAEVSRLLRTVAAAKKPTPTVVLSDQKRPEPALTLLRDGAADYLDRPIDQGRLGYLADALTLRARYLAPRPAAVNAGLEVLRLGECEPFLFDPAAALGIIMNQVKRLAPQQTTLLLTGETGTGKTRLARLCHELSPRREQPFVVVNCASLASTLIESELFGHVRGAFTGADRDRDGKFCEAGTGTILLDEVDALEPRLQAKLLRVVDERTFEPLGSNRSQTMCARLIVATNRDLKQEVAAGNFRSDLYYRLNVVGIYLPPLRESRSAVAPLIEHYLQKFSTANGWQGMRLQPEALRALEKHCWPGNVRELRHVIERMVALATRPELGIADLPDSVRQNCGSEIAATVQVENAATLHQAKVQAEAGRIREALQRNNNNRLRAAAELGISRMTLYKKLQRYGLVATPAATPA
jgi:DNA-binding NtrC family response regulator